MRDGPPFDEACQVMRVNHGVGETEADLVASRAMLPQRVRRRLVPDEGIESIPSPAGDAETAVIAREAVVGQGYRGRSGLASVRGLLTCAAVAGGLRLAVICDARGDRDVEAC